MANVSIQQNSLNAMLVVFAGGICIFTPISLFVKSKLLLSDTLVATLLGIVFGPVAINLFDPFAIEPVNSGWINVVFLSANVVLAVQIIAATIELPRQFWKTELQSFLVLLFPITFYTWVICTLMVWGVCNVSFLTALLVGAIISPTDPVLVGVILKGRFADMHVNTTVRELLSGESAGNDGVALPLVLLAVYLLRYFEPDTSGNPTAFPLVPPNANSVVYASAGEAILKWFLEVMLYQVCVGALLGIVLGFGFRKLLLFSKHKRWIDQHSLLSFSVGLALFTLSGSNILGTASFIACFFAGLSFVWSDDVVAVEEIHESQIQEVIDILLSFAFFIFFGTTIPWGLFNTPDLPIWRLFVISLLYMIFHRLPAVVLLYRWLPALRNHKEAWFVGYFGPTAVGALSYATFARAVLPNGDPRIIPIIWWIVLTSIIVHGLSVPFTHLTILTMSKSRDPTYHGPRAPEGSTHGQRLAISSPIVDAETRQHIRDQLNNPDAFGPALLTYEMTHTYEQPAGIRSILANSTVVDYDLDEPFDAAVARSKLSQAETSELDIVIAVPRVSFGVSRTATATEPTLADTP